MHIDVESLSHADGYKLITNVVIPRPIAWITSRDASGVINLAPYSFFNAMGSKPLIVAIGVGSDERGDPKHTGKNIVHSEEFVVNLVTENLLDAMTLSAADFPDGESELAATGLATAPSIRVSVPRVALAEVSLECELHAHHRIGENNLIIGRVLAFHIADKLIGERFHINNFVPIGRLGSPSMYSRTTDRFDYPRVSYAQWKSRQ